MQPMDQYIILAIKMKCNKMLLETLATSHLGQLEHLKKITLKETFNNLRLAWLDVKKETIRKSWIKIGVCPENTGLQDDLPEDIYRNHKLLNNLAKKSYRKESSLDDALQWLTNEENLDLHTDEEIVEIVNSRLDPNVTQEIIHPCSKNNQKINVISVEVLPNLPCFNPPKFSHALGKLDESMELGKGASDEVLVGLAKARKVLSDFIVDVS